MHVTIDRDSKMDGLFKSNISLLSKYDLNLIISDFSCQYNIGQYRHENLLHKLIKNYTTLIWSLLLYQEQKRIKVWKVLKFNFCVNLLRDTSHVVVMKAHFVIFMKMFLIFKLHNLWKEESWLSIEVLKGIFNIVQVKRGKL